MATLMRFLGVRLRERRDLVEIAQDLVAADVGDPQQRAVDAGLRVVGPRFAARAARRTR